MKLSFKLTMPIGLFTALLMLLPNPSLGWTLQAACPDVLERGHLNVLTINLLFSEFTNRNVRLERIANYIEAVEEAEDPVDIILLQEVIGGSLSGTTSSAVDLKQLLAQRGLNYNLRYRLANGLPGIFSVGNAILSRCKIVLTIAKTLPAVTEEPFEGFEIPLRRKIMISRIKIPNYGKINVYNTHLCAFCDSAERLEQTSVMLDFINDVENLIWGESLIILGGDFNIPGELIPLDEAPEYNLIVASGLIDTYATANDCTGCCDEITGEGCTFAVPGNPFAINPFTQELEVPVRIDYIFVGGFAENDIIESVVIFNDPPNLVSDHSAVLTRVELN
ncbi:MAG: endonuclease/exonuclease/phosphatase family protein [Deltaproteobacteria bacterium]|nr:endonuclease/exonuclease/phosphatase family protein [Deltaproteobacteria bacterium]